MDQDITVLDDGEGFEEGGSGSWPRASVMERRRE
jgi:hypothetical protein